MSSLTRSLPIKKRCIIAPLQYNHLVGINSQVFQKIFIRPLFLGWSKIRGDGTNVTLVVMFQEKSNPIFPIAIEQTEPCLMFLTHKDDWCAHFAISTSIHTRAHSYSSFVLRHYRSPTVSRKHHL